MLRWRLILGTIFVAAVVGLCWLDVHAVRPGIYLSLLATALAVPASFEMLRLYRAAGYDPSPGPLVVGSVLPVAVSCIPIVFPKLVINFSLGTLGWLTLGLTAGLAVVLFDAMRKFKEPGNSTLNAALSAFSVQYIGGCLGLLVHLRVVFAPGDTSGFRGLFPLATLLATVKLSDIGQYVFGRLFGRHKLAPLLSPGKTWEGAIGGVLVASLASAAGVAYWLQGSIGLRPSFFLVAWAYAVMLCIAGIMGDLAESLLKRDAKVKDSSDWLPGFGGVLDLLDSILLAAPVGYLWWVAAFLGP